MVLSTKEVDPAMDLIGEIMARYTLLFTAAGVVDVVPALQSDWKAIFREPWIKP